MQTETCSAMFVVHVLTVHASLECRWTRNTPDVNVLQVMVSVHMQDNEAAFFSQFISPRLFSYHH